MKLIICLLFFFFFFLSIHIDSAFADIPNSEEELLQEIIKLESEDKYHTALRMVDDFILENQNSFKAETYRFGLMNNAEYPINEIQDCIDQVLSVDPKNLLNMMNQAVIYFKMEEYEKSRDKFKEVMNDDPTNKAVEARFYVVSLILDPENDAYFE